MKTFRRICLVWHRYAGLFMAVFLAVAGLTGSILAFMDPIQRYVAPQLYASPQPGVSKLDLATLTERAIVLLPQADVSGVQFSESDQVQVNFRAKKDPATGRPYDLGFTQFYMDPWTGKELAHRTRYKISEGMINLMPWMSQLHDKLLLGSGGFLFMGIVAVIWTVDCFVAAYLTFPPVLRRFWHFWKTSWQVKTNASTYRLNLDLHRAFGLWLWPMLFVFAWSSVGLNLGVINGLVMNAMFGTPSNMTAMRDGMMKVQARMKDEQPSAPDWHRWLEHGERLFAQEAAKRGVSPGTPKGIGAMSGMAIYQADTGREDRSMMIFNPSTDEVFVTLLTDPTRDTGSAMGYWFQKLHLAHSFGLAYEIFVAVLGVVITMFSVTGVYLWWTKRGVRRQKRRAQKRSAATLLSADDAVSVS